MGVRAVAILVGHGSLTRAQMTSKGQLAPTMLWSLPPSAAPEPTLEGDAACLPHPASTCSDRRPLGRASRSFSPLSLGALGPRLVFSSHKALLSEGLEGSLGPSRRGTHQGQAAGREAGVCWQWEQSPRGGHCDVTTAPSPGSCKPTPHALPGRAQALSGGYLLWL